ncbi:MAG: ABC transporter permease [Bryobacteraceae bacterium]|nr:ABC transporter permease [Bryobacteraceae bacterium]
MLAGIRAFVSRLRASFRKGDDVSGEIDFHLQMLAADYRRAGVSEAEALDRARRDFGNTTALREQYRERQRLPFLDESGQDLRFAWRMLRRNPSFTFAAVLTIALGIGANAAVFSVLHGVLLRKLPYGDPARLVFLWQTDESKGGLKEEVSVANFLDWRDRNRVFSAMALAEPYGHELTGDGEPESYSSWLVTDQFFDALGVRPMLGRSFEPQDFRRASDDRYLQGSSNVVILGHALWRQRFGADPAVVGRRVILRGRPMMVVGVMPPEAQLGEKDLLAPRVPSEADTKDRFANYRTVVARLKPDATIGIAQQEMRRIAAELAREHPRSNRSSGVLVKQYQEEVFGTVRPALLMLMGAVAFVLLIACANVANLLLARGAGRGQEFAMRAALGATRGRLARQLFTEVCLLAFAGGTLGIALAHWGVLGMKKLDPGSIPRLEHAGLNGAVLGYSLLLCVLTSAVCTLLPALRDTDVAAGRARGASGSRSRHFLRGSLAVVQIAAAVTLLSGAGILGRSLFQLLMIDPGFRPERIVTLEAHIWKRAVTAERRIQFVEQTLELVRGLPGVTSAAVVTALPLHPNAINVNAGFQIPGRPASPGEEITADHTTVSTGYFQTMGVPLRRGRWFTEADHEKAACRVMVNETLARRFFPGEDPVGRRLLLVFKRDKDGKPGECEIVGLVGDVRQLNLDRDPNPEIYLHYPQNPNGSLTYVARASGDPAALTSAIKERIWSISRDQPFTTVFTGEQLISRSTGERRFYLILLGVFAAAALGIAFIGIYGLISFNTSARRPELGIRIALGATRANILGMILGSAMRLAVLGVALGVLAATGLARFLKSMLFQTETGDPITLVTVALLLGLAAIAAAAAPAFRASRTDPSEALRAE